MSDFYALLRITPEASKLDIINAYRRAKLTFRKNALAVYSLYTEDDLVSIRLQIDRAYAVLSDREKRQSYDAQQGYASVGGSEVCAQQEDEELLEDGEADRSVSIEAASLPVQQNGDNVVQLHRRKARDYDPDLERRIQTAEVFSGGLLREVREYRGIALEDVVGHTRISKAYLQAIENEDVAALPARAYLKGYVGQYAAEIGLEPHRVVQGYPPLSED